MKHIPAPLARSSDPVTSFQAADSVKELIKTHERQITRALRLHGANGVDAIAAHCGLAAHAVGKRMKSLFDQGVIQFTGRLVKSDSGRQQREWVAA